MTTWHEIGIVLPAGAGPEVHTTCPKCSPTRKKKTARCLSANLDKLVWHCAHCGWAGSLKTGEWEVGRKQYVRPDRPINEQENQLKALSEERCIPEPILRSEGIVCVSAYMPQLEETVPCFAFLYVKNGQLVNIKYRALKDKTFRQVSGAEKVLYRQDRIALAQVIITEGEIDALSCVVSGFDSVVSVPDGAPAPTTKNYTAKFTYLDQDPDPFDGVQDIILAVDADEPGQALQRELGRRLGTDRCRFVTWPEGCKDANDVLRTHGAERLRACLEQAQPFPVQDVINVADIAESVCTRYASAPAKGLSTGWATVDQFYTVEPGQLSVVTGIPSSGKSEWLDALALNLAAQHGWRFALCSPENTPVETHCAKLIEKHVGKPFWVGPSVRMSPLELGHGLEWLSEHVTFILPEETLTIQGVLDRAAILVRRKGIKGLIIDPFNEFDHTRDRGCTETEYIGQVLGLMKRWARKHGVHVWLVAHPQKLYRRDDGTYPVPTPYDISGSSHFRNKADNCITVWRDMENPDVPVQIHVQKVRFKHIGSVGMAELAWQRASGRYVCPIITREI